MTSLVRRVAGVLTVVEGMWLLYSYFQTMGVFVGCRLGSGSPLVNCGGYPIPIPTGTWIALVLVAALIIVGALGMWGASIAYPAGSALSTIALLLTGYTVAVTRSYGYLSFATNDAALGVAFSLVALLVNLQAMRAKSGLSEQANPMNLPVFG